MGATSRGAQNPEQEGWDQEGWEVQNEAHRFPSPAQNSNIPERGKMKMWVGEEKSEIVGGPAEGSQEGADHAGTEERSTEERRRIKFPLPPFRGELILPLSRARVWRCGHTCGCMVPRTCVALRSAPCTSWSTWRPLDPTFRTRRKTLFLIITSVLLPKRIPIIVVDHETNIRCMCWFMWRVLLWTW